VPEPRAQGLWILERCQNERFPYRLQITRGAIPWLVLRVQDRWPAANRNIFCLREKEAPEPGEVVEEMERIPLTAMQTVASGYPSSWHGAPTSAATSCF